MYKRALGSIALLIVALFLVDSVDAQRRRRRRRPSPPPTEQVEAAPDAGVAEPPPEGEGVAQEAPREGTPPPPAEPAAEGEAAATGEESEAPAEEAAPEPPIGPDLAPLRAEYTAVMDELVNVRSRMAVLGRQLFHTKVRVHVHNLAGGDNTLARLVVSLDGAPVHRGDGAQLGEDVQKVFEGFAAPGPHVLTIEVEQRQRADDDYRYTVRDSFRFTVERERLTDVTVLLDDDSDMGEDFEDDGEAEYDVSTRVRVETRELRD